ncbi:hypothetical protein, partial [Serratia fonticola]|uniref:hypothetical protein n=1 Tax=Serratia fonticola TaxID=47917 RepID=UPI003AAD3F14
TWSIHVKRISASSTKVIFIKIAPLPFFYLSMSMDIVILFIYGNLNEQNVIKNKIETIFERKWIKYQSIGVR